MTGGAVEFDTIGRHRFGKHLRKREGVQAQRIQPVENGVTERLPRQA